MLFWQAAFQIKSAQVDSAIPAKMADAFGPLQSAQLAPASPGDRATSVPPARASAAGDDDAEMEVHSFGGNKEDGPQ